MGEGAMISSTPRPPNYKTQLCRYFLNNVRCRNWPDCRFAHGEEELNSWRSPTTAAVRPNILPPSRPPISTSSLRLDPAIIINELFDLKLDSDLKNKSDAALCELQLVINEQRQRDLKKRTEALEKSRAQYKKNNLE